MSLSKLPIFQLIARYTSQGHERSLRAKKNIISSLVIKGSGILISFVTLPLVLDYIDASSYGIWLTLGSIVGWFAFFDIGLTQGLRNRFAIAKAEGNHELAQIYVSTTYAILGIVFLAVWVIFLVVNNFLDWSKILNVSSELRTEVTILAVIVFTYFCLTFVFKIITTILTADQQPAKASLIDLTGQTLSMIIIIVLVKTTEGSLIKLGLALCLSTILILLGANIVLFVGKYRLYRPIISKVKFSYTKYLLNLGIKFFIIQIAAIIQFQTAQILIARHLGTSDVTSYHIVYKYFGILFMVSNIFLTPFWSAATEAYQKNDIQWIKNAIKRYNQLNLLLFLGSIILLLFSSVFYELWLGEGKVTIMFSLSFWGFVYYNVMMFGSKYVFLLNGISALRIQFIASLISPFIYIPIALLFLKGFHLGAQALFMASIIANFNGYLLAPLQYHMVVNKNKKGIWTQ
jgi:O-antigen/teichoic acid export membrane protein